MTVLLRSLTLLFLLLAGFTAPLLQAQSQTEMNEEAQEEFEEEDAKLNRIYKKLSASLDDEARAKLRAAQRAWVAFRDLDAELAADLEARGGSMAPLTYNTHRTTLTTARASELAELLEAHAEE